MLRVDGLLDNIFYTLEVY
uniref:Uncharacterized protein n=1 Tax=Anguilla anguilla TaxID=7936 RepID=A0A0E9PJ59_ANGAN